MMLLVGGNAQHAERLDQTGVEGLDLRLRHRPAEARLDEAFDEIGTSTTCDFYWNAKLGSIVEESNLCNRLIGPMHDEYKVTLTQAQIFCGRSDLTSSARSIDK